MLREPVLPSANSEPPPGGEANWRQPQPPPHETPTELQAESPLPLVPGHRQLSHPGGQGPLDVYFWNGKGTRDKMKWQGFN